MSLEEIENLRKEMLALRKLVSEVDVAVTRVINQQNNLKQSILLTLDYLDAIEVRMRKKPSP